MKAALLIPIVGLGIFLAAVVASPNAQQSVGASLGDPRIPIRMLPFTITQPGSYYVAGHLKATSPLGVDIRTGNVTLDLNGFTLEGLAFTSPAIRSSGGDQIRVFGGKIEGWRGGGIDFSASSDCEVSEVAIDNTEGSPVIKLGDNARVSGCLVNGTSSSGGIRVGTDSTVRDCQVINGSGVPGIQVGDGGRILDCAVRLNNSSDGIVLGKRCRVQNCNISDTGCGIRANNEGSQIADCVLSNTGANFENAAMVVWRGTVRGCTILTGNVQLNAQSTRISDCDFISSGANLHLINYCTFIDNTVTDCTLVVDGTLNQIDSNRFFKTPAIANGVSVLSLKFVDTSADAAASVVSTQDCRSRGEYCPQCWQRRQLKSVLHAKEVYANFRDRTLVSILVRTPGANGIPSFATTLAVMWAI